MPHPESARGRPSVSDVLAEIERQQSEVIALGQRLSCADSNRLFGLDLLAFGVIKRALTVSSGFRVLVRDSNFLCAAALLRMQLDSALRFHAAALVDEPHRLAIDVMAGKPIRKMKDRAGRLMTDAYLAEELSKRAEWVGRVYKATSGFVHLSDEHMFAPVHSKDDPTHTVTMLFHEKDLKAPEVWLELVICFRETNRLLLFLLDSWVRKKAEEGAKRPRPSKE